MSYFNLDDQDAVEKLSPVQRRRLAVAIGAWQWDVLQRHPRYDGKYADFIEEMLERVSSGNTYRPDATQGQLLEFMKHLFTYPGGINPWLAVWTYAVLDVAGDRLSPSFEFNSMINSLESLGIQASLSLGLPRDEFSHVVHLFIEQASRT